MPDHAPNRHMTRFLREHLDDDTDDSGGKQA
jgi:hypothetical protein